MVVNETKKRGWSIPGGKKDSGETFRDAAIRECFEETGINVELKGILKIIHKQKKEGYFLIKIIFYAEPIDEDEVPK